MIYTYIHHREYSKAKSHTRGRSYIYRQYIVGYIQKKMFCAKLDSEKKKKNEKNEKKKKKKKRGGFDNLGRSRETLLLPTVLVE